MAPSARTTTSEAVAGKRAERQETRRRQIAARAADLLRTHEYFGFSVDDLCDALGINKTTFYRYFPSKEQLLFELHQWTMDEIEVMAEASVAGPGGAEEKLRRIIRGQIELQQKPGISSLTIPQMYVFSRAHCKIVLARRDAYEQLIRELIEAGIEEGAFRPIDARLQTLFLLTSLNGIQNWYRMGGALSPEQLAGEIADAFFVGMSRR